VDSIGSKKQHLMPNSTQMTYNVVEDLSKLSITLPFTEVLTPKMKPSFWLSFVVDIMAIGSVLKLFLSFYSCKNFRFWFCLRK
jgi:hypothetical protein